MNIIIIMIINIMFLFTDAVHTQGPLDGSLYAKVCKKDSTDTNGFPSGVEPVVESVSAPVDHALSVSSDSGNSTASIKTDRTDDHGQQVAPVSQQPTQSLSPAEKRELDRLLNGLETPMQRNGGVAGGGGASPGVAGVLHLVPAQVHVNGHVGVERETDILDDELPINPEGNSVDSLGTLSSLEGRATPADLYYQPETVINGQTTPHFEHSQPEPRLYISPLSGQDSHGGYAGQNGVICRSVSLGATPTEPKLMPRAPARTTSSRDAVQRGLNIWHQFGVPEEPVTDGVHFSPALQSHSLPEFPKPASQSEIDQSIEALHLLMQDLDPVQVPRSYSPPSGEGVVITTQPSFLHTQAPPLSLAGDFSALDSSPPSGPRSPDVLGLGVGSCRSYSSSTSSPTPREPENISYNIEGLVAHRVAGK